jgi:hypothetical protein
MSPEQGSKGLTFGQKLLVFRDFGFWPDCGLEVLQMAITSNIQAEVDEGKNYCAQRKLKTAQRVGLEINLSES